MGSKLASIGTHRRHQVLARQGNDLAPPLVSCVELPNVEVPVEVRVDDTDRIGPGQRELEGIRSRNRGESGNGSRDGDGSLLLPNLEMSIRARTPVQPSTIGRPVTAPIRFRSLVRRTAAADPSARTVYRSWWRQDHMRTNEMVKPSAEKRGSTSPMIDGSESVSLVFCPDSGVDQIETERLLGFFVVVDNENLSVRNPI